MLFYAYEIINYADYVACNLTQTIKCMIFPALYTNTHSHKLKVLCSWLAGFIAASRADGLMRLLSAPLVCWIGEKSPFVPSAPNCPGQRSRFLCRAFVWPDRAGQDSWLFAPMEGQLCKRERSMQGFGEVWLLLSLCCGMRSESPGVECDFSTVMRWWRRHAFFSSCLCFLTPCVGCCVCVCVCAIDGSPCLDLLPFSYISHYHMFTQLSKRGHTFSTVLHKNWSDQCIMLYLSDQKHRQNWNIVTYDCNF